MSQWAVQSRLRSNDGPDVMDYVACGAGMEPDGMLGAGGDSGDERATRQVLLHVPLTLSLIKFLVGSIFSRELSK